MKKLIAIITCVLISLGIFTACGADKSGDKPSDNSEKLKIVTTVFPEYDWVMQILGKEAENAEKTGDRRSAEAKLRQGVIRTDVLHPGQKSDGKQGQKAHTGDNVHGQRRP